MVASTLARYCWCGCGASIDHMHANAQYLPACRKRLEAARAKGRHQPNISVPFPRQHCVRSRTEEAQNRRQSICEVCCGMPWARQPDRLTDDREGRGKPVSLDGHRCRGCGEPYAPEPKPEPMSVLISSGALAAREGEIHGQSVERGVNFKLSKRKSGNGKV